MSLNLREGEYFGDHVKNYEHNFLKLSLTSYGPQSVAQKHDHQNPYLSILTNGRYIERNHSEDTAMTSGDILFRPGAYSHENIFGEAGGNCFNIEFKSGWKDMISLKLQLPNNLKFFKAGILPPLYRLFTQFKKDTCSEDMVTEYIIDWLFEIDNKNLTVKIHPAWVDKARKILENELDTFHTLNSLSERLYVHPTYLARAFKNRIGATISEYQLKYKLSNSMSLLLNTDLCINDISYRNGFYDDAHFIRSFRSAYHMPPQKFRKLLKG